MIASPLLHSLIVRLGVDCNASELNLAVAKAVDTLPPKAQAAEFVRVVLTHAKIKGVQPMQLVWRRFDLLRLPALVRHEDQWWMAERLNADSITLTDETAST